MRQFLFLSFLFLSLFRCYGTGLDSISHINKKRLTIVLVGVNATYVGSMIALNEIWYKNSPRSPFHFFNDNSEWLQMDKAGHFTTAFHESIFAVKTLQWAGVPDRKAKIYGSLAGFIYQSPIEILDGYSAEYGASWGDLTANASGSILSMGQYLLWDEIRIQPKFSFHRTSLSKVNPNLLGSSLNEEVIKDYNGQTYWLSFNFYSFMKKETKFPKWLNLSLGYGINNMVRAQKNQSIAMGYTPYRQYYLSLDFDLSKVNTKRKWIKYVLYPLNFIKVPFPTLEYSNNKFRFHPLYF